MQMAKRIGGFLKWWDTGIRSMFLLGSFFVWLNQLWINKGCDRRHLFLTTVITLSRFFTIFWRLSGRIASARPIHRTRMNQPPIFIIGHWRSGTTHLHNLIGQDKNIGYMTMTEAIAPEVFVFKGKLLKKIMARYTPSKRPMDNLPMSPDVPQEEEFAMANMSNCSFYHLWVFPRSARYYFDRYAVFQNLSRREAVHWKKTYGRLLDKITLNRGDRRLVLKNPVNTGRIPELLELFPDAKFIHICRNPYEVFPSTVHLYEKMLEMFGVQDIPKTEIEENILLFYERLLKKYLGEKDMIPPKNLVEIRYEELETAPMSVLRRIYEELNLPGFSDAEPIFADYIETQSGYRKNTYRLDPDMAEKIRRKWQFSFDAWGYAPGAPQQLTGDAAGSETPG